MLTPKRIGAVIAAVAFAMTLAVAGYGIPLVAAHGAPVPTHTDVVGYIYVNDNTAGVNTVAGFAQHANGSLTPLHGSPYAVGGAGLGVSTGSQGAIQLAEGGRFVLAVDAGSNQISVLRVQRDGSLSRVGAPISSGGVEPTSIAVHGHLVYVANTADSGANYTGFVLGDNGALTPLAHSTYALPAGSQPGDVLFNGDGTRLVGTRVGTSEIDSFVVGRDGRLTAAPGSPYAAQAAGPFGSDFSPTNSSHLYVSNAHAGTGNGSVSAYSDGSRGVLKPIGASPYADKQTAPCWVDITPDGRYLFTVNTGDSTISSYAIAASGKLTLHSTTAFKSGTGLSAFDIRIAPNGKYAYVVLSGADKVAAFAVHNGRLAELANSAFALPAGATPFGIVVKAA